MVTPDQLAQTFINLQEQGAHNINLVSPTPYTPVIARALKSARLRGLNLPVVYNTNAYENVEVLRCLEGLVDIYLPDLKHCGTELSSRYCAASDYFTVAGSAVKEMYRQVGAPVLAENGLARRGTIIRHLVMPGHVPDSIQVLRWIADNLPGDVYVSLMAQYFPAHRAAGMAPINRRLKPAEYDSVVEYLLDLGLENGFVQEMEASSEDFVPVFDLTGVVGVLDRG